MGRSSTKTIIKAFTYTALLCMTGILIACQTSKVEQGSESFAVQKTFERPPIKFTLKASKQEITIAERLMLVLQVQHQEDYQVELPQFGEQLEQFGIVDYSSPPAQLTNDNRVLLTRTYELEPFLSGEYRIPAMQVHFWKSSEGAEVQKHVLESEELVIKVTSLLPEDGAQLDIKEIAPPLAPARVTGGLILLLLICSLVIAALIAGIVWQRRKRAAVEQIKLKPHQIAFQELEQLISAKLIESGETKEFYLRLSLILRVYIEERFGLRAPEQTTEEFLQALNNSSQLVSDHKLLLGRFLEHCDMVKFAKHAASHDEIEQALSSCKQFIEETLIDEEPEQQEVAEEI